MKGEAIQIGDCRFFLREVASEDQGDVVELHRRVFGPDVDASWFRWKYVDGGGQAVGLWDERGKLVAHCGGIPRRILHQHDSVAGIQIGDVMVAPEVRGLLTRRGPFFHVSQRFYSSRIGEFRPHQLAFGFPNERHLRLAVKLGLLWDGGPIEEMRWTDLGGNLPWNWRCSPLDKEGAAFERAVGEARRAMESHLGDLTAGCRDTGYVRWRFLERPNYRYRIFRIHRPWSWRTAGLVVLRLQGEVAHWLDWIGPPHDIGRAAAAARIQAAEAGARRMVLWGTPAVCAALENAGPSGRVPVARLGIPRTSLISEAEIARRQWWWLGGDTDFL